MIYILTQVRGQHVERGVRVRVVARRRGGRRRAVQRDHGAARRPVAARRHRLGCKINITFPKYLITLKNFQNFHLLKFHQKIY